MSEFIRYGYDAKDRQHRLSGTDDLDDIVIPAGCHCEVWVGTLKWFADEHGGIRPDMKQVFAFIQEPLDGPRP